MAEATKPRGIISVLLIGLVLGPLSLMLWIGRARLGFLYLAVGLIAVGLVLFLVISGYIAPIAIDGMSADAVALTGSSILGLVALVHAFVLRGKSLSRPWYSRWYVALVLTPLVASVAVAFLVRTFLFQPFSVPSGAMYPTFAVGDHFFVSKQAYGYSKYSFNFSIQVPPVTLLKFGPVPIEGRVFLARAPERGDVAVFKLPRDGETDYIKRVIGLPGDRIQMRDGVVYINGDAVKKERIGDYENTDGKAYGGYPTIPMYRETLPNGVSYYVLDAYPNGDADNTPEFTVPPNKYFMLGDNRDNSQDSRHSDAVGFVPEENFVGPAVLTFWNDRGLGREP